MMQAYRTENSYRSAARLSPAELRAANANMPDNETNPKETYYIVSG